MAARLENTIALYPKTLEFMDNVSPPSGLEVRYEESTEQKQAEAIRSILSKPPFARQASQVTVGTTTPNFVSIFVPNGG